MKKFYWFGDSWLTGSELELVVPKNTCDRYVFAKLISNHFSVQCVNLGQSGSSPDIIPYLFSKIAHQLTIEDTIFFCLSAPHRTMIFSESGVPYQIMPGANYNKKVHPYTKEWYKYFDTEQQRLYNYDRTVNLLYLWCQQLGVTVYFCNLFTTMPDKMLDIVPESAWIYPRDRCVAQFILHNINDRGGVVVSDDIPDISIEDWDKHKVMLEKYVKPGYCHPNIDGHKKIAEELIKCLDNKTKQI
jgi:hypothetical protein